ncbi:hypothetical protein JOB18_045269 [Solea senegalensis]|uniref:Uncharacterized protein n=1 Tax=Solea senegalensis TaxID=28829 RepID=A0AAV6SE44_SOLSE|nr:hypothetical protein JOB18_045269 [Solea senegalensis]
MMGLCSFDSSTVLVVCLWDGLATRPGCTSFFVCPMSAGIDSGSPMTHMQRKVMDINKCIGSDFHSSLTGEHPYRSRETLERTSAHKRERSVNVLPGETELSGSVGSRFCSSQHPDSLDDTYWKLGALCSTT